MSDVNVRILKPEDWKIFREIRLKALQENPSVYLKSYQDEAGKPQEYWSGMLDGQGKMVCCLFDGNEAVGFSGVVPWRDDPSGKSAVMVMDFVDARYRGQGLSRLLYQARIDWAVKQQHFQRVIISHREGNEASRRANQVFGFVYTGKELIDWPDGTKDREHYYELDLNRMRHS